MYFPLQTMKEHFQNIAPGRLGKHRSPTNLDLRLELPFQFHANLFLEASHAFPHSPLNEEIFKPVERRDP